MRLVIALPKGMSQEELKTLLQIQGITVNRCMPVKECPRLTPAERAVLQALACYDTPQEIAAHLHIGERAVKTHLRGLVRKLGAPLP